MARLKTLQLRVAVLGHVERKPWQKSAIAPKRLSGRRGVERRKRWLAEHPLCAGCERKTPRRVTAGTVVDHVISLAQGGRDDDSNFQTLCDLCHDDKSLKEKGYKPRPVIGLDGYPR